MKGLTDIPGIRVGHATDLDALTGCTVILCEDGAVAGCDIGGGASGTTEFDVMNPQHVTPAIHGITLAGGSAFGLEAASGVRRYLEQKGVGFPTAYAKVPIVPGAILFDLGIGKAGVRPTRETGEAAAAAATDKAVQEGCVGAGTGATVGKAYGMERAMKSGIGSFTIELPGGLIISALAAVNAYGDVVDPSTGKILAGCRTSAKSNEFANAVKALQGGVERGFGRSNTTLCVVATNARLTKVEATKVARMAQAGLLRAVRPAHTMFDGDVVIALSLGAKRSTVNVVGVTAADALAEAIIRGVKEAKGMGGLPGLKK